MAHSHRPVVALSALAVVSATVALLPPRAAADPFVGLSSEQGRDLHAQVRARIMTTLVMEHDQTVEQARGFAENPPTDRALVLPDFCPGCDTAHYWVINPHDQALFALDVKVQMNADDGEDTVHTMFVPVVPSRTAVHVGFPIPWETREVVPEGEGGTGRRGRIGDDIFVTAAHLSGDVVRTLVARPGNFQEADGALEFGGETDGVNFALGAVGPEEGEAFAHMLREVESPDAFEQRAVASLGTAAAPSLLAALPPDAPPRLAATLGDRPGALAEVLANVSLESASALAATLSSGELNGRLALIRAAMATDQAERLSVYSEALSDETDPAVLGAGWQTLDRGPLVVSALELLRRLEAGDAQRSAAAEQIARRYIGGEGLPAEASRDIDRLYAAVPDAFAASITGALEDRGPFTYAALHETGADPLNYMRRGLRALEGCDEIPPTLEELETCAAAIEANEELRAVGQQQGLAPWFQSRVLSAFATESDIGRRGELTARFAAIGLDGLAAAEGLCEDRLDVIYDNQAQYIDAARVVDPAASCVVEADGAILGLSPFGFAIALAVFLAVLALVAVAISANRKRQRRIAQMMLDSVAEMDDE